MAQLRINNKLLALTLHNKETGTFSVEYPEMRYRDTETRQVGERHYLHEDKTYYLLWREALQSNTESVTFRHESFDDFIHRMFLNIEYRLKASNK